MDDDSGVPRINGNPHVHVDASIRYCIIYTDAHTLGTSTKHLQISGFMMVHPNIYIYILYICIYVYMYRLYIWVLCVYAKIYRYSICVYIYTCKHVCDIHMAVKSNSFLCKWPFFANKKCTSANLLQTLLLSFIRFSCQDHSLNISPQKNMYLLELRKTFHGVSCWNPGGLCNRQSQLSTWNFRSTIIHTCTTLLHYITLHYITLNYSTLHCSHYITLYLLHCITLHYTKITITITLTLTLTLHVYECAWI